MRHALTEEDRSTCEPPLIVNVDGTLVRTEMLIEHFFYVFSTHPFRTVLLFARLWQGTSAFKAAVATAGAIDPALIPYNDAVLSLIKAERAKGRQIYLATAVSERSALRIVDHINLFDGHFASSAHVHLSGAAKAERLKAEFGDGGFDYVGHDYEDLPVWDSARRVYVVDATARLQIVISHRYADPQIVSRREGGVWRYAKALRVHQWLKNILVFLPALAAHDVTLARWSTLLLAFLSFSACASSVYLLNDLLDLHSDRQHPTKRSRPFASGALPLRAGLILAPSLLLAGCGMALVVSPAFLGVLMAYYALTTGYSLYLKRLAMLDVVTLGGLYGMRIIAGGIATAIPLSYWLVTFAIFLFLFLALVKRATELVANQETGTTQAIGRGYAAYDLGLVEAMAAASGFVSVMVLALYFSSLHMTQLYTHPEYMWSICLTMQYWIGHVLLLTHRGQMHDDPLVFAVTDHGSLGCGVVVALIIGVSL